MAAARDPAYVADAVRRVPFATRSGQHPAFSDVVCRYERPLVCYPGQERAFEQKRRNITLSLAACDGAIVKPGETFSFWRLVGRPTAARGYGAAAAIQSGVLVEEIGGAICLSSTLLYNAGLLSGMEIIERRCHSVDSYGDQRYFELGRDAAVEYPYTDLRLRNRATRPLFFSASVRDRIAVVEVRSTAPAEGRIEIEIDPPEGTADGFIVRGRRITWRDGSSAREDLPVSVHRHP